MAYKSIFLEFADLATYRYPVSSTIAYGSAIATEAMLFTQGLHAGEGPDMFIGGPAVAFLITGMVSRGFCGVISGAFNRVVDRRVQQAISENAKPKPPQARL